MESPEISGSTRSKKPFKPSSLELSFIVDLSLKHIPFARKRLMIATIACSSNLLADLAQPQVRAGSPLPPEDPATRGSVGDPGWSRCAKRQRRRCRWRLRPFKCEVMRRSRFGHRGRRRLKALASRLQELRRRSLLSAPNPFRTVELLEQRLSAVSLLRPCVRSGYSRAQALLGLDCCSK